MTKKRTRTQLQWRRMDLHLHTPASTDYQEPGVSFLDILRQAENKGLDIIAFTDHNTVAGYRRMQEEIHHLELLEKLGRLRREEKERLAEYRRLLSKILVLPGFEFTATFGFHILGIFSPETDLRELEFLLRRLNVPLEKLDQGSVEVGATADVLTAYRAIAEAGGIVITAHANSANGVAMWGFDFGGQTRIAYTQDPTFTPWRSRTWIRKAPVPRPDSLTAQNLSTRAGCGVSRALMPIGSPETRTILITWASATG
ncbi:MAG: hypothetical protein RMK65_00520 [Anaerolineae bacterium]|nr:hypothetical protein [Anaerolineae bacterium]